MDEMGATHRRATRIVVVEDEDLVRSMVVDVLAEAGHEVVACSDAQGGLEAARGAPTDLCVLDLNLPDPMKGLEVCRRLRADPRTCSVPVLVLTGNKADAVEAAMFDAGADDYVRKNDFRPRVFLRRVDAILRRARAVGGAAIEHGPLWIDPGRREARLEGRPMELSPTEFDVLYRLVAWPDRTHSREDLLDSQEARPRTVDVRIMCLRRKLGPHAGLIQTVVGFGYRLGVVS